MGKIDVLLVIFSLRANKKKAREKKIIGKMHFGMALCNNKKSVEFCSLQF